MTESRGFSKIHRKRSKIAEVDEFIRSLYGSDTESDEDLKETRLKKQFKDIVQGFKAAAMEVSLPSEPSKDIPQTKDSGNKTYILGNERIELPGSITSLSNLFSILNINTWNQCLTEEEKAKLKDFLPKLDDKNANKTVEDILSNKNIFFGNPVVQVHQKIKDGSALELVAKYYQKIHHIEKEEHLKRLKEYHESMLARCIEYKEEKLQQSIEEIAEEYSGASKKKIETPKPPTKTAPPTVSVVVTPPVAPKPQVTTSTNPPKIVFKLGKDVPASVMQEVQKVLNIQPSQPQIPVPEKSEPPAEISPNRSPTSNPVVSTQQLVQAFRQNSTVPTTNQFASFPLSSNPSQFNIPSSQNQYNTFLQSIVGIQQKNTQTFTPNSLYTTPAPFALPNAPPNPQFNLPNSLPTVFRNEISGTSFPSFSFTTQFKGTQPLSPTSFPTQASPPSEEQSPEKKEGKKKNSSKNKTLVVKAPTIAFYVFTTIRDVFSNAKDKILKTDDVLALVAVSKHNVLDDLSIFSLPMKFLEIVLKFLANPPPGPNGVPTEPCVKQISPNQWQWIGNHSDAALQSLEQMFFFGITRTNIETDDVVNVLKTLMSRQHKTVLTIKPRSQESILLFRRQEQERYANPDKAYAYIIDGGGRGVVPPLKRGASAVKAREHALLKPDRPPSVSLLCVVRDAAARLPGGIGTRQDVAALLKESQYIVDDAVDQQVSTVVSGTLDRLQSEEDACVRYDSEQKFWIYLHRRRKVSDYLEIQVPSSSVV